MEKKHLDKWKETRKQGKRKFIIVNGIVKWGLVTGVLFFAFQQLVLNGLTPSMLLDTRVVPEFAVTLGIFMLGGILFGSLLWSLKERR
ncbi:hypothetical protein [Halobacillus sp. B23F22_1]|uniref:hypothetical protein n=1 Tax=Halobacillus sp. B23F22_1 TaxID=3459514 RepID=UPI00373FA3D4